MVPTADLLHNLSGILVENFKEKKTGANVADTADLCCLSILNINLVRDVRVHNNFISSYYFPTLLFKKINK